AERPAMAPNPGKHSGRRSSSNQPRASDRCSLVVLVEPARWSRSVVSLHLVECALDARDIGIRGQVDSAQTGDPGAFLADVVADSQPPEKCAHLRQLIPGYDDER